jgi:hypothetical protein
LTERTDYQLLDFFRMSEYVSKAAVAVYKSGQEQENFKKDWRHRIKHHNNGASELL